jgi:hypothetical protein
MGDEALGAQPPEPVKKVRADALSRAEKAWNLRVLGGSWEQAARVAGYSDPSNAIRAVRSVYGSLPEVERSEARRLWRDRLEVLWRQVVQDVHERIPGATTAAVRIADRAARLDGLDEPSRLSITPSDGELQRFVSTVIEARGGGEAPDEDDIFGDVVDAEIVEDDEPA